VVIKVNDQVNLKFGILLQTQGGLAPGCRDGRLETGHTSTKTRGGKSLGEFAVQLKFF
jgi:hypothetical protein